MLRLEEVATVENAEIRQQLRHLVLPVTSLALSGHQVFALEGKNVKMLQKLGLRDESASEAIVSSENHPRALSTLPSILSSSGFKAPICRRDRALPNAGLLDPGASRARGVGAQPDGLFGFADRLSQGKNGFPLLDRLGRHRERLSRRPGQLLHPREPAHALSTRRTRAGLVNGDSGEILRDSHLRRHAAQFRAVQRTDIPQSSAATATIDRMQVRENFVMKWAPRLEIGI